MEDSAAKALRNLTLDANNDFISILKGKRYSDADLVQMKLRYSEANFQRKYDLFDKELRANIINYRNYDIISVMLKTIFDKLTPFKGDSLLIINNIMTTGYEVEFMLKLKIQLDEYLGKSVWLCNKTFRDFDTGLYGYFKKILKEHNTPNPPEKNTSVQPTVQKETVAPTTPAAPTYRWNASDTDFLELFTALYKSEAIVRNDGSECTRKEFLEYFQQLLHIQIKDSESKLTRACNRNRNTVFLDELAQSFRDFTSEKARVQQDAK